VGAAEHRSISALRSGVAPKKLLEIPGKRQLSKELTITIQQRLYVGYRTPAAIIEQGALLSALVALLLAWGQGAAFWLIGASLVALMGAVVVFVLVTDRQNRLIRAWQPEDPPSDWMQVLARWELSHGIRAACS
jgi:uncharacterized membrane protein